MMMMRLPRLALLAGTAGLLSGCLVGPDYDRPPAITTPKFKELAGWKPSTPRDAIDRGAWWSIYGDPVLDGLEKQVAAANQTVKEYEAAYRQSTALIVEARAGLLPTLSLTPSVTRSASGGSGGSGFSQSSNTIARTTFSAEAQASWAPDFWGKVRRTIESDTAAAEASAGDLANATLSAQASLGVDYFNLRAADALQDLLEQTVAAYRRSLEITRNQYAAGTAAKSDVISADEQLQSAQAQLIQAGVERAVYEHAIAVLTGKPPAELSLTRGKLAAAVPVVPAGLPSDLLERRPDIAAAERAMQEQNAAIGVAISAYYPTITLSALAGFTGNPLGSLFQASNQVWSLGASASETVFDGGLRSGEVAAARATYDQAVATYRQTVLTAFQGVEDELATLRILQQEAAVEDAAVDAARQAVTITLNEYRAGTVPYTTVVTAQATLLTDQENDLTVQQNRMVASVTLIEDLGGGWDVSQLPKGKDIEGWAAPVSPP